MSYTEYKDLFEKAQKNPNAKYKCVVFDLVGSKKMSEKERYLAQVKSIHTFNDLAKQLRLLQFIIEEKLLVNEEPVSLVKNITEPKNNLMPFLSNPAILNGDCFVFYLQNNTIGMDDIKKMFMYAAEKCNNEYAYNISSGQFETLDVNERNEKYWIGYVAQQLESQKHEKIQYDQNKMTM